jgi:hypothetical protein
MDFARIWRFIVLHRFAIRNWSLLLAGILVA